MQKEKLVPEIRFKGFNEKWNINALNELINKFDNLRIPVSEKLRTKGEFPYFGANGIQDYVSGYTHDGEFVLVAEDGANDVNNYPSKYVNGKFWANNHVHVIQGKENVLDNKFLSFSLKNFDFKPILTGGERSKLNASALATIEINKPFINEQQKIGAFFSNLDSFIQSQELKLKKLNEVKQSFLSKMFVSGNQKFPEIRFKGFEEKWNQKVINQTLIPVISTLTMSNVQRKGEIPLFDANSIVGYSSYALSSVPYLTIIKDGAGVGRIRKLPANSAFLGTMTGLIPRNVDIDFVHSLISTLSLEKSFSGTTIPHIYFSDYGKLKIYIPDFFEQQKVGQFFSSLDSLIHSQEQKLENLNSIKQALLEKMFC
ncbi:restriction endonuclease subunit S [Mycoplasma sp. VS509_3]|uniref:restriction endonuclease subunit S n=1 Tax=unclassified Mycoplasma TaxID=2683645 RepID=UPI003AAEA679